MLRCTFWAPGLSHLVHPSKTGLYFYDLNHRVIILVFRNNALGAGRQHLIFARAPETLGTQLGLQMLCCLSSSRGQCCGGWQPLYPI